jgi:zinc transporter ZupT
MIWMNYDISGISPRAHRRRVVNLTKQRIEQSPNCLCLRIFPSFTGVFTQLKLAAELWLYNRIFGAQCKINKVDVSVEDSLFKHSLASFLKQHKRVKHTSLAFSSSVGTGVIPMLMHSLCHAVKSSKSLPYLTSNWEAIAEANSSHALFRSTSARFQPIREHRRSNSPPGLFDGR